jgi:retron-type reverse transcriptase
VGRVLALNLNVRNFSSKAEGSNPLLRGSELKDLRSKDCINIKNISNLKNLVAAYEFIKSNPGNMTSGSSKETLDGINLDYLKRIQSQLRAGTFKFGPARRIHIPKPGKSTTRPLTVASPREKVVQKAIQQVMEPLYESSFLDSSHGFRPNRGSRTAMKYIDAKFQSSKYVIEADFSQAFPSIPHGKLMQLLKGKISCEKTLSLLKSGLKAGHVELGKLHEATTIGTPQGSILSPLLCNIYLHELDKYMEKLADKYNVGTRRKLTKEYMALQNKLKY